MPHSSYTATKRLMLIVAIRDGDRERAGELLCSSAMTPPEKLSVIRLLVDASMMEVIEGAHHDGLLDHQDLAGARLIERAAAETRQPRAPPSKIPAHQITLPVHWQDSAEAIDAESFAELYEEA